MTKIVDLSRHTSIGIGPVVEVTIIDKQSEYAGEFILGRGNNLLNSPTPPKMAMLGENYD